jgi:hypothetical protein
MISARNRSTYVLFVVILIVFFINPVKATAMSFTVRADQVQTKTLNLIVEDRVTIRFTVTGHVSSELAFHITDPNGDVMKEFGITANVNYEFVCSEEGEYKMYFSNIGSTEDKLVSLDCEVQHYIFGIPQMLFLTLIVLGICLTAVAVFVLMGKPR